MSHRFNRQVIISNRTIDSIQFVVPSATDNEQCSVVEIKDSALYTPDKMQRVVQPHGPLDLRMGTSNYQTTCATCRQGWDDCPGHYGILHLAGLPVYNWGYFKSIIRVLQSVCKTCSRILLNQESMTSMGRKARRINNTYLERKAIRNAVHIKCRKTKRCPHCSDLNGVVKKMGFMKIAHYKFRSVTKRDQAIVNAHLNNYADILDSTRNMRQILEQGYEILNYMQVFEILDNIIETDVAFLQMDPQCSHPRNLMFRNILVPPVPVRPSVVSKVTNCTTEDDLTAKVCEIVMVKTVFNSHERSDSVGHGKCALTTTIGSWDYFQLLSALMLNSELTQLPSTMTKKEYIRGFAQRLKGKFGRFRGNLSGRRVNFSGRTVISPNPNLRIDEVAIPIAIAKILTFKDRVTAHNMKGLKRLIERGYHQYPSAKYVTFSDTNETKTMQYSKKRDVLERLKIGDIVERDLMEGDFVLFNRQPSLHRLSILCMKVKITPHKTFNFNECVCSPFNADFDGDEMNIHVPQTEEARAEASLLMDTKANLVTPCNGQLIIGATQDFLSGCFLLTDKDLFLERSQTCQLIQSMMLADSKGVVEYVQLPPPAIMKPVELWTGKQIFSMILRPNDEQYLVNLRCGSKFYKGAAEDLDSDDTFIVVRNGNLICGRIDKSVIGSGSKQNILFYALRDGDAQYCADVMWRLARVSIAYLLQRGLSLGLADVNAPDLLLVARSQILANGYEYCEGKSNAFAKGEVEGAIGCDNEANLESLLNAKLSELRNTIGTECLKYLPDSNAPRIMSLSGSKGSSINVCQMVTCVGQQTVSGSRIKEDRYQARCLCCFKPRSKDPAAYGFIENSFRSGLKAFEFFFHAMAGREGLVDTAVKTAETGYMQRRLVKCLEDLYCAYDYSVRSASGDIIQFKYGSDGLDPCHMETLKNDYSFDLDRVYDHCRARGFHKRRRLSSGFIDMNVLSADEFIIEAQRCLDWNPEFSRYFSEDRIGELKRFLIQKADEMRKMEKYGHQYTEVKHMSREQLKDFLDECLLKQSRCLVEPGTPVGSICAQSVGEPCTQMTLKTFHFAGVASMNITLGVPRIKELVNAVKNVKTPVLSLPLERGGTIDEGNRIRARIECVRLKDILDSAKMILNDHDCYLLVSLNMFKIIEMGLCVNARTVCESILEQSRKKKMKNVRLSIVSEKDVKMLMMNESRFLVRPPLETIDIQATLLSFAARLPQVIVSGIESVKRVFVNEEDGEVQVLAEGNGLQSIVSQVVGLDLSRCKSNDILETSKVLGIEAARQIILKEICDTMKSHGISVDARHVMLLTDTMTAKGEVVGMTRSGLSKMKESPLMLASFEQTIDHLYDAGYYSQKDDLIGISERIITGVPIRAGTGAIDVLYADCQPTVADEISIWEVNDPLLIPFD